jgi:antitoxin MazE
VRTKVARWGNSLGLRLPKAAADAAGVAAGAEFEVLVDGPDLRLRRLLRPPYYRLEDLVAEMDRLGPENEPETVDWGPDVGAEVIEDAYSRGQTTLEDISKRVRPRNKAKRATPLRRKRNNASRRRRYRVG